VREFLPGGGLARHADPIEPAGGGMIRPIMKTATKLCGFGSARTSFCCYGWIRWGKDSLGKSQLPVGRNHTLDGVGGDGPPVSPHRQQGENCSSSCRKPAEALAAGRRTAVGSLQQDEQRGERDTRRLIRGALSVCADPPCPTPWLTKVSLFRWR
jgi:hypothetical protein